MLKRLPGLILLGLLGLGIYKVEAIRDWWWLRNYQPPAAVQALAQKAAMSDTGRRIFYLGRPEIDDKLSFASHCPTGEAKSSLVLGCYNGNRIFVLRVDRAELAAVMDVTAAHEMLHAAYERLANSERGKIDGHLQAFYEQHQDPELEKLMSDYAKTEPGQKLNELHSLLGSQVVKLSPELEAYYARYFSNQDQVARSYLNYRGVFKNLEARTKSLQAEVAALRSQITATENNIQSLRRQIETMGERMDRLKAGGNTQEYNSLIPQYNSLVRQYNGLISYYRDLVANHNAKVEQLNQLALEQNELVESLDSSKFRPL